MNQPTRPSPSAPRRAQSARLFVESTLALALVLCCVAAPAVAETASSSALSQDEPVPAEVSVRRGPVELVPQFGLMQPLVLRGGNVAADLFLPRWVIGYSHGFQLRMEGGNVAGAAAEQELAYRLPFTTGFGIGYRIFPWLDVRAEGKWHRFVVRDDPTHGGDGRTILRYDTWTVGAGVYSHLRPWRNQSSWLRGLQLSASVRWWPNVADSLNEEDRDYVHPRTGVAARHSAARIGIANSPWIVNASVGYAFRMPASGSQRPPAASP